MSRLLAEDGDERQHRRRLRQLLDGTQSPVRIASAYVTDRELLLQKTDREIRLVTTLLPLDIASGATSLETLRVFIESGVQCRILPHSPRLHAKVYIFGKSSAVVTSANLTLKALTSNIEVGVEITGEDVRRLTKWYDRLWKIAEPLSLAELKDLRQEYARHRREYAKLKKKLTAQFKSQVRHSATGKIPHTLQSLFENANQHFVCNTDRVQGKRTDTQGYWLEEEMHNHGYAAAWESFRYPEHMRSVQPGDAIFMYAKGVGIIGIGRATAQCEILPPKSRDRIRGGYGENNTPEWRVPVQWLAWHDEEDAFSWKAPPPTFLNVSEEKYAKFRKGVLQHFQID